MKTPTLVSWSLRIEQELTPNTALTIGYVGSHGYHEVIGIDANEPTPTICPASPCPAVYPTVNAAATPPVTIATGFPAGSPLAGAPVPAGSYYIPAGTPKPNAALGEHVDLVFARRQLLQRSAIGREPSGQSWSFNPRGLHLVESARQWGFLECDDRRKCSRTGIEPFQSASGLGAGHL